MGYCHLMSIIWKQTLGLCVQLHLLIFKDDKQLGSLLNIHIIKHAYIN